MLSEELYKSIRSAIVDKFQDLSADLFYHSIYHTLDVEKQAERIAISEKVSSKDDIFLLKVACLYHDSGFLFTYNEHEKAGCKLAKEELPRFGLKQDHIDIICGLIMATCIPQTPLTKLEKIICDADLDYLGRNDFFPISNNLFRELKTRNIIKSEDQWNLIQASFFKQHKYFTVTCKKLREQQKQQHLEMIEAMIIKK